MKEKRKNVEAIKLAVAGLEKRGFAVREVLADAVEWLYNQYFISGDKRYLDQAVDHILVYLELGNAYQSYAILFDEICEATGIDISLLTHYNLDDAEEIRLNKSQIRRMIGRWNPHIHSMPINDVIDDIIYKVVNEQYGIYHYYSGQVTDENNNQIPKDTYELTITDGRALFRNVRKDVYYTIKMKAE